MIACKTGESYAHVEHEAGAGEKTIMEWFHTFCYAVREGFEGKYLRHPTDEDVEAITGCYASLGWPGELNTKYE